MFKSRNNDEMMQQLSMCAESKSFQLILIALVLWTFYEIIMSIVVGNRIDITSTALALILVGTRTVLIKYSERELTKGDDEYRQPNQTLKALFSSLLFMGSLISLGLFLFR